MDKNETIKSLLNAALKMAERCETEKYPGDHDDPLSSTDAEQYANAALTLIQAAKAVSEINFWRSDGGSL